MRYRGQANRRYAHESTPEDFERCGQLCHEPMTRRCDDAATLTLMTGYFARRPYRSNNRCSNCRDTPMASAARVTLPSFCRSLIEILPKLAFIHHCFQIPMRRRNDPHVDRQLLRRSQAPHRSFRNDPQQFLLRLERQFTQLVEDDRSSLRRLEEARLVYRTRCCSRPRVNVSP